MESVVFNSKTKRKVMEPTPCSKTLLCENTGHCMHEPTDHALLLCATGLLPFLPELSYSY